MPLKSEHIHFRSHRRSNNSMFSWKSMTTRNQMDWNVTHSFPLILPNRKFEFSSIRQLIEVPAMKIPFVSVIFCRAIFTENSKYSYYQHRKLHSPEQTQLYMSSLVCSIAALYCRGRRDNNAFNFTRFLIEWRCEKWADGGHYIYCYFRAIKIF